MAMFWNTLTLAVVLIAVALYYPGTRTRESKIAKSWEQIIADGLASASYVKKKKIAVGVNVNADLIVSGTAVLAELGVKPSGQAKDNAVLKSIRDLEETFTHSFKHGVAVERFYYDREDYNKIVNAADGLEDKQYFVGGNAALAALKMASTWPDLQVLVIGPCGPRVRALLPDNMVVPAASTMETDEVHLIMEYKRQERWGDFEAPIATRFITSHDRSNMEMSALAEFSKSVKEFAPDAVFFSGLHLLDGQSLKFQNERLASLNNELRQLSPDLPVHLELASMADPGLGQAIYQQILSSVHSLGLNEQELGFLSRTNAGPHSEIQIDDGFPEVGAVSDILYWLLDSTRRGVSQSAEQQNSETRKSKLTRVHFHCLTYHMVATINGSWANHEAAVSAGAQVAGKQACDDGAIVDEKVELRIPEAFALSINHAPLRRRIVSVDPEDPVVRWTRNDVEFYFSPVLVCKNPIKTVGLGDAISATGFLYSQHITRS